MRYILMITLALLISSPAFAENHYCPISGPHNCQQQNEDYLVALTKNTIHSYEIIDDPHPFKTQNDVVLQAAAQNNGKVAINSNNYTHNPIN